MRFYDEAVIRVVSGNGGAGVVHFRREKFVPKGGPDGGDGGRGGHVIVRVGQARSLLEFHYQKTYRSPNGQPGGGKQKTGMSGKDLILEVPKGTVVFEWDLQQKCKKRVLADLSEENQSVVLVRGGRGGRGNAFFKSATHQTPRMAQPGEPGQTLVVYLELRLLADVGLVGFPNAGKSSLLRRVSNATPKVANYPFTTLKPHLGVVRVFDDTFVLSDLPGLIEGAASGAGLGTRFLKHVSRTRCLLFMIDGDPSVPHSPRKQYALLRAEVAAYQTDLLSKPSIIAVNKIDLLEPEMRQQMILDFEHAGIPPTSVFGISAITGEGISSLLKQVHQIIGSSSPTG